MTLKGPADRYSVSPYNGGQHDFYVCPTCFATVGGCNWSVAMEYFNRHMQWHEENSKAEASNR